ncbi:thiolase family protein [Actinomadura sp. SCN-SB]|uniref:thiolase family protein n=1 Tax=Actinomadura sp. SCN-SB TaxID=3373092 RepID=UPI003751EB62
MPVSEPAIIGLGMTEMSLLPGGTAQDLAHRALAAAVRDAGLALGDIDGLLVGSSQGVRPDRLGVALARRGGLGDLVLLEHVEMKGVTTAVMIQNAVLAVRAGLARTVACVFGDAPLRPGGSAGTTYAHSGGHEGVRGLERVSGVLGSVPTYALAAARFLEITGGSEEDLCAVALSCRAWATRSPDAVMREPLTREDYFAARIVAEPLRVLDCARPVNGAVAVIVGDPAVPAGAHPPVHVRGMAQRHPARRRRAPHESWFEPAGESADGSTAGALDRALAMAGRKRDDLDAIELYDPFSIVTLSLLETYGFCGQGEAGALVRSGATAPGGTLPMNTGGGQLSGFYLQGMTPLAEAIVQLRGHGGDRQVADASTVLVTGIGGRVDHHAFLVLDREAA